ncbi:MAG: polyribonucleotide nucleotidyltransferase [Bacteroidales bacterium]|jgi:polyribonucleotide nucleotidyltransferase|nr:polyribonucleotide nucleotidyltransferase [Bacteroidales bacterium]MDD2687691.1 polyribonucleotide nucleotidyltransferase [Bacteroidales bacterium]MDD3331181.1 polyribonucleotide nucleotidyltransferase [Bacteroidales bacterium]MDD3691906.1 polyribonucleotide nucleotidyltransferase [Bacteroidales bacterium]MDD4044610.1 polyribonucleotide nucleotidyltransferase [Bacteroidales bacterium]
MIVTKTFDLGDGRQITIETGKLAKQADGSVVVKMGNTMLLATVCSKKEAAEDVDFMPLQVEYQEKYAAVGRFPGGFFKREARPSTYEILIARLIDRALRPLFPEDYHAETQVLVTLISGDKNELPDALAGLAASAALSVSDIPFHGPISEVRVARIDNAFKINPTVTELEKADMDLIVAASMDNIMMVEGEMKEIQEEDLLEALKVAHQAIKTQCQVQLDLAAEVEKANPKREYCHENNDEELRERLKKETYQKIYDIAKNPTSKHERSEAFEKVLDDFLESIPEDEREEKTPMIKRYYDKVQWEAVRNMVLSERQRLDGRKLDQIRPIWCEVDYLPSAHGSAIFTRGETQSLSTCTLGTKLDEQIIDGAIIEGTADFMLHYNFPPFSTGEVKPIRGTGRREIGHGNLALRAIKPILPPKENNPYTIRLVSDILESNGSSSMATVCACTMALMDAGVQIKKPVSGIAMGMISDSKTGQYAILSDILGDEDHLGDMDFKVTGSKDGITACQMDIKVEGLSYEVLAEALEQAKRGRLHILNEIMKTIEHPREDYKPHVPRIEKMIIDREFIGAVIGPGGKIIQEMQRETNTIINICEEGEFGIIDIASPDKESIEEAKRRIRNIVAVPVMGEIYEGPVKNIQAFGAFVEILPGKDGLLHISEYDWKRIDKMEDYVKVGDVLKVKLIDIDTKNGKLKLSRKALLPKPEGKPQEKTQKAEFKKK